MAVWFLTSTTYGTRLPGDQRGFVGRVLDRRPGDRLARRAEHDRPGDPPDAGLRGLHEASRTLMAGPAVALDAEQASDVIAQFLVTAAHRGWFVRATAVMADHFHLVASADAPSEALLRDFKSYAARALSARWGKPVSGTWWTQSGSRRELTADWIIDQKVRYTLAQPNALAVYDSGAAEEG